MPANQAVHEHTALPLERDLLPRSLDGTDLGPAFALGVLDKISQVFEPLFDVKETADNFVVMTDLPGLKESQLDVEVCGGRLTITGEREQDDLGEGACYYAMDRRFGTFCLTLKERIRGMDADYHRASTAEPVERTLLDYLSSRSRSRRGKGG